MSEQQKPSTSRFKVNDTVEIVTSGTQKFIGELGVVLKKTPTMVYVRIDASPTPKAFYPHELKKKRPLRA